MTKSADAFRTISEVADWLGVQAHVLRFWESKFSQVKPVKRAGGRRYYRPADMRLLGGIRKLLHDDGLTIKGAQKVLREEGMSYVANLSMPLDDEDQASADLVSEATADIALDVQEPAAETGQVLPFEATKPEPPQTNENAANASEDVIDEGEDDDASQINMFADPPARSFPFDEVSEDASPSEPSDTVVTQDTGSSDVAASLPSFLTGAATPAPEETAVEPEQTQNSEPDVATPELPSFLQSRSASQPAPEPEAEPSAATGASPRVIDAPDPDESALHASPSVLSSVFKVGSLTHAQRGQVLPLVARLAALREEMSSGLGPDG